MMDTISSREISKLTGRLHVSVCKDIKDAFRRIGVSSFRVEGTRFDADGRECKCYHLSREQCDLVTEEYPMESRKAIYDIWEEAKELNKEKNMMDLQIVPNEVLHQAVDARQVHEELHSGKDFSSWIKVKVLNNPFFTEDQDYIVFTQSGEKSNGVMGRPRIDYGLTLDTAKKVAMSEQTERGNEVRDYFLECEKKLLMGRPNQIQPLTRRELAQMVLDNEDEKDRLVCQVEGLQKQAVCLHEQTTLDAPKVKFADTVICDDEDIDFNTYAKLISLKHGIIVGQNKLMGYCRLVGYLQSGRNTSERNKPYQKWIDRGYFSVKYNWIKMPQGREQVVQTFVTPKGQQALLSEILCEFSDRAIESVVSKQERISNDFHDGFAVDEHKSSF